jgi:hypothetical protein
MSEIEKLKEEKSILLKSVESARKKISDLEDEAIAERAKPGSSPLSVASINEKIKDLEGSISRMERAVKITDSRLRTKEKKAEIKEDLLKKAPDLSELQRDSKALLLYLKGTQEVNQKLLKSARLRERIRKETGQLLYCPGVSMGFRCLDMLIEILQNELDGKGRRLFRFDQLPDHKRFI